MSAGIYCIKNTKTNKVYIGKAKNLVVRWSQHLCKLEKNTHDNIQMQKDFNKYGINSFTYNILEIINETDEELLSKNLLVRERYWGDKYEARNPEKGYNVQEFYLNDLPPIERQKRKFKKANIDNEPAVILSKQKLDSMKNNFQAGVYIALKIIYDKLLLPEKENAHVFVTTTMLYYELTGEIKIPRKTEGNFLKAINSLIKNGIIDLVATVNDKVWVVDVSKLKTNIQFEQCIIIYREEIKRVFKINHKEKFNMLRYMIELIGTMDKEKKYSNLSYESLSKISHISVSSCKSMTKLLEENKIIYVCHSLGITRLNNGQIKSLCNYYSRYKDKEIVEKEYFEKYKNISLIPS